LFLSRFRLQFDVDQRFFFSVICSIPSSSYTGMPSQLTNLMSHWSSEYFREAEPSARYVEAVDRRTRQQTSSSIRGTVALIWLATEPIRELAAAVVTAAAVTLASGDLVFGENENLVDDVMRLIRLWVD
jgi:hypothetical protein